MAVEIPDIETLIVAYLSDFNVVDRTPRNTRTGWVRLTLLDARQTDTPDHLVDFYVQLDCYEGDNDPPNSIEASNLARAVRAELVEMPLADHDGAVVSGVEINGMARIPDEETEPARERYSITADIWAHAD